MKSLFMLITFPLWIVFMFVAMLLHLMGNDKMLDDLMDLWS